LKDAIKALGHANKLINDGVAALQSFNTLKLLVTSTVAKMWVYFSDGLLMDLGNLGIDDEEGLSMKEYFETNFEQNREYEALLADMKGLTKHCEDPAKPAFELISPPLKDTLLDMCTYEQAETSSEAFANTVVDIGEKMLGHLETVQAWHTTPQERPDLVEKGEPAGLRKIETAFGETSYFSNYLKRWKADTGDFLKLLDNLKELTEKLKTSGKQLEMAKDKLVMKLGVQQALKKKAQELFEEAKSKREQSEEEVSVAEGELQGVFDAVGQKSTDVDNLRDLFEAAWKAYKAAEKLFEDTQKKGTGVK